MEVQGKTDHHEYVNILQQHLLASFVDIFDNTKNKFRFLTGQCLSQTGLQVSRLDNYNFQPGLLPGYSLDINIISMVIHRLKRGRPLTVLSLCHCLQQDWVK